MSDFLEGCLGEFFKFILETIIEHLFGYGIGIIIAVAITFSAMEWYFKAPIMLVAVGLDVWQFFDRKNR